MTDIEIKVNITKKISYERLSSILVGYFEGNPSANDTMIKYTTVEPLNWEGLKETRTNGKVWFYCYPFNEGGAIILHERENWTESDKPPRQLRLDITTIVRGLRILEEKYPHHLEAIVEGNDDCWTSSALVECALYGDIIFG